MTNTINRTRLCDPKYSVGSTVIDEVFAKSYAKLVSGLISDVRENVFFYSDHDDS